MFFALCEVSVSLNAHDEWLKSLPNHQWGAPQQRLFMAVYYLAGWSTHHTRHVSLT